MFNKLKTRDAESAFDDAIENNTITEVFNHSSYSLEGNYIDDIAYMHSDKNFDYFKNIHTRKYIRSPRNLMGKLIKLIT